MKDEQKGTLAEQLMRALGKPKAPSAGQSTPDAVQALKEKVKQEERKGAPEGKGPVRQPIRASATQFSDTGGRPKKDIVVGFDFGTSCSKVVVQDPDSRDAWAVPFDGLASTDNRYLLPTRLTVGADGEVRVSGEGHPVVELKVRLMSAPDEPFDALPGSDLQPTARQLCALYLAQALRRVRLWFLTSKATAYRSYEIDWQVNVGIPSSTLDDAEQQAVFEQVICAAWRLSIQDGPISWSDVVSVDRLCRQPDFQPGLHRDRIHVYPEIAAEVTGYARSDLRRSGLHLMVDIGASTLDVSSFLLFDKEGLDNFSFLVTDVQNKGTFFLRRHRVDSLVSAIHSRFDPHDLLRPGPDDIREMLPTPEERDAIEREFSEACRRVIADVLIKTKTEKASREPQFQIEDPAPLPVFVAGGGSLMRFYDQAIKAMEKSLHRNVIFGAFDIQKIPRPRRFEAHGLPDAAYHRLAVAYGLSFRFMDLGAVIPPSRISDMSPLRPTQRPEFVGKDMV